MEFFVKSANPQKQKSSCLVIGIFENEDLSDLSSDIDSDTNGLISNTIKCGDISGKKGETFLLPTVSGISPDRILLIGCGKKEDFSRKSYLKAISSIPSALPKSVEDTFVAIPLKYEDEADTLSSLQLASQTFANSTYKFDQLKSEKSKDDQKRLKKVTFYLENKSLVTKGKKAVAQGLAISNGQALAKELANLPGNICTPTYLADQAKKLAKDNSSITTQILSEKEMEKLKMGSLLSVSRGSREEAKLIVMKYNGGKKSKKPIVIVGKGLTFDAGGISLKPAAAMDEMKYDMCGGASVFGTIQACAELELPINVIGVVPSSENLPDGQANKPGDIVTSMSGKTIEILNTDAEGRLILCDALTYSAKFKPEVVIDIATLTGACIIALGSHMQGIMGNDSSLVNDLLEAGITANDKGWELPLEEEYAELLKSNFADLANIGGRDAGTITAGCFLSEFTKDYTWAHIDIAGTAWKSGKDKGATGRPIPLLVNYLLNKAG